MSDHDSQGLPPYASVDTSGSCGCLKDALKFTAKILAKGALAAPLVIQYGAGTAESGMILLEPGSKPETVNLYIMLPMGIYGSTQALILYNVLCPNATKGVNKVLKGNVFSDFPTFGKYAVRMGFTTATMGPVYGSLTHGAALLLRGWGVPFPDEALYVTLACSAGTSVVSNEVLAEDSIDAWRDSANIVRDSGGFKRALLVVELLAIAAAAGVGAIYTGTGWVAIQKLLHIGDEYYIAEMLYKGITGAYCAGAINAPIMLKAFVIFNDINEEKPGKAVVAEAVAYGVFGASAAGLTINTLTKSALSATGSAFFTFVAALAGACYDTKGGKLAKFFSAVGRRWDRWRGNSVTDTSRHSRHQASGSVDSRSSSGSSTEHMKEPLMKDNGSDGLPAATIPTEQVFNVQQTGDGGARKGSKCRSSRLQMPACLKHVLGMNR